MPTGSNEKIQFPPPPWRKLLLLWLIWIFCTKCLQAYLKKLLAYKSLFHIPTLESWSTWCLELDAWSLRAVDSHFNHPNSASVNWVDIDLPLSQMLTSLLGANADEIAVMNTLTSNLNSLLCAFYKPEQNKLRFKNAELTLQIKTLNKKIN